jgi:hypothetical protein
MSMSLSILILYKLEVESLLLTNVSYAANVRLLYIEDIRKRDESYI